jgi:hypothetical protein
MHELTSHAKMLEKAIRLRGDHIDEVARKLRLACCEGRVGATSCSYLGVWPADHLPKASALCSVKTRGARCCYGMKCFIANTDPARASGEHWVAFVSYANRPNVVGFFDSYGYPISYYKHLAAGCEQAGYFDDAYTIVSVNARTLQHAQSVVCGHYCLLYLYLCARVATSGINKVSAMQFLVMLTNPPSGGSDRAARDALVLQSLRELLRRSDTLAPALHCSLNYKFGARKQCCKPRRI